MAGAVLAIAVRAARLPDDLSIAKFVGAACLCGIGDTMALLMADQAFTGGTDAAIAKIGVLAGSIGAAIIGAIIIALSGRSSSRTTATPG